MNYIWIVIAAIFGVLIGVIFTSLVTRKKVSRGTLVIDLTDPERDVFRIILDEDLESLAKQKSIRLDVEFKSDSQQ